MSAVGMDRDAACEPFNFAGVNPRRIRDDFPLLRESNIVYFDSASTALKPDCVIDSVVNHYRTRSANVGRSVHAMAEAATEAFENVRAKVGAFLGCTAEEIIFTGNCTEAINLVAASYNFGKDDEVLVSVLEHHSNYVPWAIRANLATVPVGHDGTIDPEAIRRAITSSTRLIAITMVSNVTGNVQPVNEICAIGREMGIPVLVDAAQAIGHIPVDIREIGCDFLVFSAHKMFAPSGCGVLYAKASRRASLRALRYGGGMVNSVGPGNEITYHAGPLGLEGGTPNIEGVIGLGTAIDYIAAHNIDAIACHGRKLDSRLWEVLSDVRHFHLPFGRASHRIPTVTLAPIAVSANVTQYARLLSDAYGIAVSAGLQCAQPLYHAYGLQGGVRVSAHIYNTTEDVDRLATAMVATARML